MATAKQDIKEWLLRGKKEGATHVIVVCDTFEYDDYPVMVMPKDNIVEKIEEYNGKNMQRIMEVYNLSMDLEKQLDSGRSYNL